jgi:ribose 5-phosphate isomerase A
MKDDPRKRLAALSALEHLPESGVIGLGTGSTSRYFIEGLSRRLAEGHSYQGVPTSVGSREFALELNIPLLADDGPWDIAVCVDGADEVSANLDLIKGGGGAHTREKIVNYAAQTNIIVVDESKLSERLGERRAVPIEVLGFAHQTTAKRLAEFGEPSLRLRGGAPVRTDSGNPIYDLRTGPIDDPAALDRALQAIPGVVETGLFCGRADLVIIARGNRVEEIRPTKT